MEITIADSLGSRDLLQQPLTAFLCSRKVPATVVLKCYDWAIDQREKGRCVISGFHSTIEKDVFHYLLKGTQAIIVALHRGIGPEIRKQFKDEIASGRLLIISPFKKNKLRGGAADAAKRNQLMIGLAEKVVIGHASRGGELERLLLATDKKLDFLYPNINLVNRHNIAIDKEPLILQTKTGYYMYSLDSCSVCGRSTKIMYEYSRSTWGPVILCDNCQPEVCERSFGSLDVMNFAESSAFETNRRKH